VGGGGGEKAGPLRKRLDLHDADWSGGVFLSCPVQKSELAIHIGIGIGITDWGWGDPAKSAGWIYRL